MTARAIGGAPVPAWLGALFCGGAGYAMGTTALVTILESERFDPNGPLGLLVVGLAPGLLSAGAAWVGSQPRRVWSTALATMLMTVVSSLGCAPITWILLAVTGGETQIGHIGAGDGALGILLLVTVIGGFLAVPLGVGFGLVYSAALAWLRSLRSRPSRSALDLALLPLGLVWAGIAAPCIAYLLETHPNEDPWLTAHPVPWSLVAVLGAMIVVGLLASVVAGARLARRHLFVRRARRGGAPGWAVVDADAVDEPELPRLFSFGDADRVLLRRETATEGPFRSGETATAVALV